MCVCYRWWRWSSGERGGRWSGKFFCLLTSVPGYMNSSGCFFSASRIAFGGKRVQIVAAAAALLHAVSGTRGIEFARQNCKSHVKDKTAVHIQRHALSKKTARSVLRHRGTEALISSQNMQPNRAPPVVYVYHAYLLLSGISHVAVGGFLPLRTAAQVRRRPLLDTQPPPAEALPEG